MLQNSSKKELCAKIWRFNVNAKKEEYKMEFGWNFKVSIFAPFNAHTSKAFA